VATRPSLTGSTATGRSRKPRLTPSGAAADRASVRDARTGKVTALVPEVPGIPRFRTVTAAAGGLFYLTADLPTGDGRAVTSGTGVFRLVVDSGGQVAELTALPEDLLPPGTRHVAVTPDGSRRLCAPCRHRGCGKRQTAISRRNALRRRLVNAGSIAHPLTPRTHACQMDR
jgi:hypothetical protein